MIIQEGNKGRFTITIPGDIMILKDWKKGKVLVPVPTDKGVEFVDVDKKK